MMTSRDGRRVASIGTNSDINLYWSLRHNIFILKIRIWTNKKQLRFNVWIICCKCHKQSRRNQIGTLFMYLYSVLVGILTWVGNFRILAKMLYNNIIVSIANCHRYSRSLSCNYFIIVYRYLIITCLWYRKSLKIKIKNIQFSYLSFLN